MAGKHWTKKDMKFLREQRAAGKSFGVIAKLLEKSEEAIRNKCKRMGLDDNDQENLRSSLSDDIPLPAEIRARSSCA